MKIELIKDESNKIIDVIVDDKPVKRGSIRGLKKAQETPYWRFFSQDGIGVNRFSGVPIALTALELMIFEWCMGWCNRYEQGNDPKAPIQTFDDMKYFMLELNSNAYMELLD